jgi:DNA polymerase III epsilon subunit-like protein
MFGGGSRWKEWVDPWIIENNMNHILDDYDPAKALTLRASVNTFVDLVRGRHIVGCNPRFDIERIHRTWIAFHQDDWMEPWHYHLIDVGTLMLGSLTLKSLPTNLPWKAGDLSLAFGVDPADFEPKHSALADARFAKACWEAVMGGPQ